MTTKRIVSPEALTMPESALYMNCHKRRGSSRVRGHPNEVQMLKYPPAKKQSRGNRSEVVSRTVNEES